MSGFAKDGWQLLFGNIAVVAVVACITLAGGGFDPIVMIAG